MTTFNDKTVLVTGAAKRIGAEIARGFHREGARVVIHYNSSADAATSITQELNDQRPDSAHMVKANLGSQAAAISLAERATGAFGRLDILVNNASVFMPTPVETVSEEQLELIMSSNFNAPLFLSQAALPELRKRKGCIVNMVDVHASGVLSKHLAYGPSKAAMQMLTRILAADLAPDVRVNGISPGAILWPENSADQDPERQARLLAGIPLKTLGSPEDISALALFLCSPAARYITGQIIAVDGGSSLAPS